MLPIVVDAETTGLNPATDALLEIAFVALELGQHGQLFPGETFSYHIDPFEGAHIDPEALVVNGIDPTYPLRYAIPEQQALHNAFRKIKKLVEKHRCQRAILVGHNVWFDLAFIQAAIKRCRLKSAPFHSFTTLDTASLAGVALGETVLARAVRAANIPFDIQQAHSGVYDAKVTAELFCWLVNNIRIV